MTDFKLFVEKNALLKKTVAAYLGVSNAFITQLCDGTKKLPADKFALIKANEEGWDLSMFDDSGRGVNVGGNASGVIVNGNNSNSPIDNRHYYSDSPDVLRAQIDILDERIKEKDAQIKEKDAQINRLLDLLEKLR